MSDLVDLVTWLAMLLYAQFPCVSNFLVFGCMRSIKKEFKEGLYLLEKSDEAVYGLADADFFSPYHNTLWKMVDKNFQKDLYLVRHLSRHL